jgi:ATP-dependent protease HslVU (ClpYQ) peptidase subunit
MTCIVGLEYKGDVYLGCDSAQSNGHFISAIDCPKIFTKGDITFGYTTSFRFADILQYDLIIPDRVPSVVNDREYLVSYVIKAVRDSLKEGGFTDINNNKETGGTCLIVYHKQLFTLQDDFSIIRDSEGYAACGSGCNFALGSLSSTSNMKPKKRLELALQAAIKHCATVQGPITVRKI